MRATTTAEATRLAAPARVVHHRVEIQRSDATWVDVTDWWLGTTLTEDRDAGTMGGTLRLRREARRDPNAYAAGVGAGGDASLVVSLAPLVTLSPANLVDTGNPALPVALDPLLTPFRGVRLSAAVTAPGETPGVSGAPALTPIFAGLIDDPSWGGTASVLEVPIRDLAARMQDALIEVERDYTGGPIATMLATILTDNGFAPEAAALRVVGDTEGWTLGAWRQLRGVSVWEACRALVLRMGWDFRYWYHADGAFVPTLLKPARDVTTPAHTFLPAQVVDLPRLVLKGSDVRNAGELWYTVAGTTDTVASVTSASPDSIAEFGRRAFGIDETQEYARTAAEAQQMLDAAVDDLSTPFLEQDAVVRFWWPLQLGDAIQFDVGAGSILPGTTFDTNRWYDTLVAFGVTGLRHDLSPTTATTTLSLRGRPVGAFRRWKELISRAPTIAASAAVVAQVTDAVTETLTTLIVSAAVPSPLVLTAPASAVAITGAGEINAGRNRMRARVGAAVSAKYSARCVTAGASGAAAWCEWIAPAAEAAGTTWAPLLIGGTDTPAASLAAVGTNSHAPRNIAAAARTADEVIVRVVTNAAAAGAALGSSDLLFYADDAPDPTPAPPGDPNLDLVFVMETAVGHLVGADPAPSPIGGAYTSGILVNGYVGEVTVTEKHVATISAGGINPNPHPPPAIHNTVASATFAAPYALDPDLYPASLWRVYFELSTADAGYVALYQHVSGSTYRTAGPPSIRFASGQFVIYYPFAIVGSTTFAGNTTPADRGPATISNPRVARA